MAFAELEKSPEHVHIYRITPISLWNAAAASISSDEILDFLDENSRYPVPNLIRKEIFDRLSQFGMISLILDDQNRLVLTSKEKKILQEIYQQKHLSSYFKGVIDDNFIEVRGEYRGQIKLSLIKLGYPVEDLAGYKKGEYRAYQ